MPRIEVVCAETPEVDALLDQMRDQFSKDAVLEQTYLAEEVDVAGMSALFAAAAALYRAEPWQSALADHAYVFVTIKQLDLDGAVLALTGQRGHSPGLVLLASLAHYSLYCAALPQLARGDRPVLPRQLALNFERGAELSPGQRKEIVTHHWEVAGPDAYPWLVVLDEDLIARSPTPREVSIAEALSHALCVVIDYHDAELEAAAYGETVFCRELRVETSLGELSVVLEAPQAVNAAPQAVNSPQTAAPAPEPVHAPETHKAPEQPEPSAQLAQDDRTQGKLAANTGMASPLYPPR